MSILIAFEYNPLHRSGQGAVAVQLFGKNRFFSFYPRWCVRGFNEGYRRYGKVAIVSGYYRYRIDLLYNKFKRPLLIGMDNAGARVAGGYLRTIGPNQFHEGAFRADRVWLHGMYPSPIEKPEYHTDQYVGSSACHGPLEPQANLLAGHREIGDSGHYLLLRPSEPFERMIWWFRQQRFK